MQREKLSDIHTDKKSESLTHKDGQLIKTRTTPQTNTGKRQDEAFPRRGTQECANTAVYPAVIRDMDAKTATAISARGGNERAADTQHRQ